jgi:hypothetical protein
MSRMLKKGSMRAKHGVMFLSEDWDTKASWASGLYSPRKGTKLCDKAMQTPPELETTGAAQIVAAHSVLLR